METHPRSPYNVIMKKKTKIILIIISIFLFSLLLYFLPTKKIIGKLPILSKFYNNTTLEISIQNGKAKVWINGENHGESPVTVQNLPEGKYSIELERIVDEDSFYEKIILDIDLTRNTTARIDLEIGPDQLLHGAILYYTPIKTSSNKGLLTVSSNVDEAKVFIDKEFLKISPLTNFSLRAGQYEIKVTAKGHEEVGVPVLIRNNYALNLKTYHFPIPVSFDSLNQGMDNASNE